MKTNKSAGIWCLNSSENIKSSGKQSIATYVLDFLWEWVHVPKQLVSYMYQVQR